MTSHLFDRGQKNASRPWIAKVEEKSASKLRDGDYHVCLMKTPVAFSLRWWQRCRHLSCGAPDEKKVKEFDAGRRRKSKASVVSGAPESESAISSKVESL